MQVTCPNCGAKVTADHINIHQMTAVCANCDTIFPFNLPTAKAKRRKVKQPAQLILRDDDTLEIDFRTNFRLDRNETVIASTIGGLSFLLISILLLNDGDSPAILTGAFFAVALTLFYIVALTIINKTHLKMDEDAITLTRGPLPNPLNQVNEISLAGVTNIKYEETALSKKEAFDTPRYQVWAETEDGSRRIIITNIIEEYAVYIAQRLDERLQTDLNPDTSRLEDDQHAAAEEEEAVGEREKRGRRRG